MPHYIAHNQSCILAVGHSSDRVSQAAREHHGEVEPLIVMPCTPALARSIAPAHRPYPVWDEFTAWAEYAGVAGLAEELADGRLMEFAASFPRRSSALDLGG